MLSARLKRHFRARAAADSDLKVWLFNNVHVNVQERDALCWINWVYS